MDTSKVCILIVDDDWLNREFMAVAFTAHGYEVVLAASGKQALRLAADRDPDLTLLDVRMPDLDGYHVCAALKNDETTKHIRVVLISALDYGEEEQQKAQECGADDFVSRALSVDELNERIRNLLQTND